MDLYDGRRLERLQDWHYDSGGWILSTRQLFLLVDKQIVARAERTQLAACEKIASLNRYWNPAYIYVDQGYGATQIEVLQSKGQSALMQFGPNNPDARLRNIVKPFDFGKTVPIYDPFTSNPFLSQLSLSWLRTL